MAVLLLIRHAVTASTGSVLYGRAPGLHLSEAGLAQARDLGQRLQPIQLSALYASPLERCVETASPLLQGRRLTVRIAPELIEGDCGAWTGRRLRQLARTKAWNEVQRSPGSFRFPGGESFLEIQHRAVDGMGAIAARHRSGIVAVVSHGDLIRLALSHYAGAHIDNFQRIVVSPASVSVVALGGGGPPRIVRTNDTGSLKDLIPRRPPPGTPPRPPAGAGARRSSAGVRG
jgi:probable phosphoglycerate mutase